MRKKIFNPHPSDVAVSFDATAERLYAACFNQAGEIAAREFSLSAAAPLYQELKRWRASELGHARTDLDTIFRFVPFLFTEQTKIAALEAEVTRLPDADLTRWLIDAARRGLSGTNSKPLFETDLSKSAYDFARLPTGEITLTELPREVLFESLKKLLAAAPLDDKQLANLTSDWIPNEFQPVFRHAVETRLRAIARAIVCSDDRDLNKLLPADTDTLAIFAFTPEGFGFALWNKKQTFYGEFGEMFYPNIDERDMPPGIEDKQRYIDYLYEQSINTFLNQEFYQRVNPTSGDPIRVKSIAWTASNNFSEPLVHIMNDFCAELKIKCEQLEPSIESLIVRGLLLAHNAAAERLVPSVNLANDLTLQNQILIDEDTNLKAAALHFNQRLALACLLLPIVLCAGLLAGWWLNAARASASLEARAAQANQEIARLKPVLEARNKQEEAMKFVAAAARQIKALRDKQESSLSFAANLDPLFPNDAAFFISNLNLAASGAFEMKGLTRDEFKVSEFVRSMEFAEGSGAKRLFTNLQLEFRQGSRLAGTTTAAAGAAAAPLANFGNLAPGVSAFSLKGNFALAAPMVVQPATSSTTTAAPAAAAASASAAAPPAPAANTVNSAAAANTTAKGEAN